MSGRHSARRPSSRTGRTLARRRTRGEGRLPGRGPTVVAHGVLPRRHCPNNEVILLLLSVYAPTFRGRPLLTRGPLMVTPRPCHGRAGDGRPQTGSSIRVETRNRPSGSLRSHVPPSRPSAFPPRPSKRPLGETFSLTQPRRRDSNFCHPLRDVYDPNPYLPSPADLNKRRVVPEVPVVSQRQTTLGRRLGFVLTG